MTQPYNAIESEMGISSYMSTDHEGFAAVSKARYSDFVVHEVNREGKVARLESLLPPPESKKRKQPDEATNEDETLTPTLTPEEQWKLAESKLTELVGQEASTATIRLLQYWEGDDRDETTPAEKYITLPKLQDKEARRALHELVRSQLAFCARGDTHDGRVRIWHKSFEKEMPNYGKFDRNNNGRNNKKKKTQWPSDRPDFLQFVLYKENMDTSFAGKEVLRRVSQGGRKKVRIGYAGMKDKRGVTTQFCTLYRQEPEDVVTINKGGRGGGNTSKGGVGIIRVGNFEYVPNELQLGMLSGNRFDVVLRNVDVSSAKSQPDRIAQTKKCLEAAALALRENGFINYFGMQRFGKYYDTHKVGICVLKGDFVGAVEIIMQPKSDEHPRAMKARKVWAKRFEGLDAESDEASKVKAESSAAKEAVRDMGRFMTCEVAILNSLARKPLDYRRAFSCIPKNMRLMFLHALQSYLWNRVASFRIDSLGRQVVVGDLVLTSDKSEADGGSGTSGLEGKVVKVVDATDVSSGKYDITDVVLPLVGSKVQYPENESGALYDSLLAEQGVTKLQFGKVQDRELSLGGDYRKLVCKPSDVDFEIIEYSDPLQPLLQTDLMKLDQTELDVPKSEDNGDILLGMVIGFTLPPSSYATMALRELMKRPTSGEYQRQLKLEGRCEEDLSQKEESPDNAEA